MAPAPGSVWEPGLGSGPGEEVWVWPRLLPEEPSRTTVSLGGEAESEAQKQQAGHALMPTCVHTQHTHVHTLARGLVLPKGSP